MTDLWTNLAISGISNIINNRNINRTIRETYEGNESRKNISNLGSVYIEGLMSYAIQQNHKYGSYVVSGGTNTLRVRTAAAIAKVGLMEEFPVIILHEGNGELFDRVVDYTNDMAEQRARVDISGGTENYDPFYNRSSDEIFHLIVDSMGNDARIGYSAKRYVDAMIDFVSMTDIYPYCDSLLACPHDDMVDKINDMSRNGYISDNEASALINKIMQGQNERYNIEEFFSRFSYQSKGKIAYDHNSSNVCNIKDIIMANGLALVDVGSSTNDIFINIIMNEINEMISSGYEMMLILDNINIKSNSLISRIATSNSGRCRTTLVSEDVYSTMLNANDDLFRSFVGNATNCVVYTHNRGVSSEKWSEAIGRYEEYKVSQNVGNSYNYGIFGGGGIQNSVNLSSQMEYIVKPEEIRGMPCDMAYILDKGLGLASARIVRLDSIRALPQ